MNSHPPHLPQSLGEFSELVQGLIENLPGGAVFVLDQNLHYQLAAGDALALWGCQSTDFVGQTVLEALPPGFSPGYEEFCRQTLEGTRDEWQSISYGRIYRTVGTPLRSPNGEIQAALLVCFDKGVLEVEEPPGQTQTGDRISDLPVKPRQLQATLQEIQQRQNFLLTLSDALRPLGDATEIHETVTRTAMNYFHADRCYYCEIKEGNAIILRDASREDLPSVAGVYPLTSFPLLQAVIDAGHPFVVEDVQTTDTVDEELRQLCIQLQMISYVDVPVIKNEQAVGVLCLVQSTPTTWSKLEVELAMETADRTWAAVERANAEAARQTSEEKFRAFVTVTSDIIYEMSADWLCMRFLQGNEFVASIENPIMNWVEEYIPQSDQPQVWAAINQAISNRSKFELEHRVMRIDGTVGWTFSRAIPVINEAGEIVTWFGAAQDMTARREAEIALGESEAKYRSLFDSIDVGFAVFEMIYDETGDVVDYQYLEVNQVFERQSGLKNPAGQLLSQIAPVTESYWLEIYDSVARTGKPLRIENYHEDTGRWYLAYASRFGGVGSRQVAVVFDDITDRKRSQEQQNYLLQLSDALRPLSDAWEIQATACRLLGEHLKANLVHYGETIGDHVVIQQGYSNGLPPMVGSFRSLDFGQRLIADYQAGRTTLSRDILSDPTITPTERQFITQAGFQAYIAVPLTKAEGWVATLAVHSIAPRDWTTHEVKLVEETAERTWATIERSRAEELMRSSDARLRAITDAAPVLIWETDEAGVSFVNRYYLDFFGISFENLRERGWARFMHPEDAAGYQAVWQQCVQQRQPFTQDCRFLNANGQYRWLRNTGQPVGENRIVGCSVDITEVKQAEADRIRLIQAQARSEQERQRAEALAELDRAKTQFFSNISHEFRTPLTLLLAPLEEALSDRTFPLPPVHQERLQIAQRNSLRLLKLVNTLLDLSQIEVGRMEALYEPTDLAQLTTDLASVFRSAVERAGLKLIVDCPPLSEPMYIDRPMWEKIIFNLLSNALKFTQAGHITVSLHPNSESQAILQIRDTGQGIAPEHLPHLFERFYQIRELQNPTHEGSGIGLALVYELVQLLQGTLTVSSTLGEGTTFTITLPFGTSHLPPERIAATPALTSSPRDNSQTREETVLWLGAATELAPGTELPNPPETAPEAPPQDTPEPWRLRSPVLIIDDNADMRQYLQRLLSQHFPVKAVADGASALALIQTVTPALILSDIMMPGIDGLTLLQTLRADPRTQEIPFILLSALAGEQAIVQGLEAQADDYIIKPFSPHELVTRIKTHLAIKHLRSEALQQARTTLKQKDELLNVVSHELNTPLASILGWTRLLRATEQTPRMLSTGLSAIEHSAMMQEKLVQDLLDISRISANQLRLNLKPTPLEPIIQRSIETVAQIAYEKGVELRVRETAAVVVLGDSDRLEQILCNLLNNGIKFTPKGGRVELSVKKSEQDAGTPSPYTEIRVTDTGVGIRPDFLPLMFEKFRQADEKHSQKGLGLGLAIARHLVELHQGTIEAYSAGVGQGATFIIRLPVHTESGI